MQINREFFVPFYEIGDNEYSMMTTDEGHYIGFESYVNLGEDKILQGFKVLPVNIGILRLLMEFVKIPPTAYVQTPVSEDENDEENREYIYANQVDLSKLRVEMDAYAKEANIANQYIFLGRVNNDFLKVLYDQGWKLFFKEQGSRLAQYIWLVQEDDSGVLKIMRILLIGTGTNRRMIESTVFVLNKMIAMSFFVKGEEILKQLEELEEQEMVQEMVEGALPNDELPAPKEEENND